MTQGYVVSTYQKHRAVKVTYSILRIAAAAIIELQLYRLGEVGHVQNGLIQCEILKCFGIEHLIRRRVAPVAV